MSPASREINSSRLTPLKIHKDSHLIHKTNTTTSSASSTTTTTNNNQRHHPVIIYTHSPKVIHTQARDFMALVQKLTGLSHAPDDDTNPPPPRPADNSKADSNSNISAQTTAAEDSSSSSSENSTSSLPAAAVSPLAFEPLPPSHFMPEIPLFTPNSSDFFCSPGAGYYRYPESSVVFCPPNNGSGSPFFIDAVKSAYPNY